MTTRRIGMLALLLAGVCIGVIGHAVLSSLGQHAIAQTNDADPAQPDLKAEIEAMKGKLADQAHAMQDVGYHFSNLWFAGKRGHWELANFYWSETRSHLHWAVRIIPVRQDNAGNDVKLTEILEAVENGPLKELGEAIAAHDDAAFEVAYRASLEGCYSCHKASDKPYIRLRIPAQPETPIVNFDPDATWPR